MHPSVMHPSVIHPSVMHPSVMHLWLQVYLGKWQETDVAIKVLTEVQNLSASQEAVCPQDPATLHSWRGDGPPPLQGGNKSTRVAGLKVISDDTGTIEIHHLMRSCSRSQMQACKRFNPFQQKSCTCAVYEQCARTDLFLLQCARPD